MSWVDLKAPERIWEEVSYVGSWFLLSRHDWSNDHWEMALPHDSWPKNRWDVKFFKSRWCVATPPPFPLRVAESSTQRSCACFLLHKQAFLQTVFFLHLLLIHSFKKNDLKFEILSLIFIKNMLKMLFSLKRDLKSYLLWLILLFLKLVSQYFSSLSFRTTHRLQQSAVPTVYLHAFFVPNCEFCFL